MARLEDRLGTVGFRRGHSRPGPVPAAEEDRPAVRAEGYFDAFRSEFGQSPGRVPIPVADRSAHVPFRFHRRSTGFDVQDSSGTTTGLTARLLRYEVVVGCEYGPKVPELR